MPWASRRTPLGGPVPFACWRCTKLRGQGYHDECASDEGSVFFSHTGPCACSCGGTRDGARSCRRGHTHIQSHAHTDVHAHKHASIPQTMPKQTNTHRMKDRVRTTAKQPHRSTTKQKHTDTHDLRTKQQTEQCDATRSTTNTSHTRTHPPTHTHSHTHAHTHTHANTHTHRHTNTYTHTHTQTHAHARISAHTTRATIHCSRGRGPGPPRPHCIVALGSHKRLAHEPQA